MHGYRAKVTAKGQVTLPKGLRARLGLKTGDYLQIKETGQGYLLEKEQDELRFHKFAGLLQVKGGSDELTRELRGE